MACLQEWDADRRQAAHAEKSLAVRELVRLSLRVQSTGVVAELHLDTALVATSGSGADHERRIRRGCQATDGRADNWRGVLNNATDEHAQLLRDALCDPDFCMRFAIRRRIGSGGTVRLQWLFRTNSVVGRTEEQVRSHINLPAASYEAAYWVERNLSSYDEVVRDVIYLRSGASFEREAEAPAALHLVVPPELDKRGYWKGTGFTGVYWLQPGQPVYGHPSYRHSYEAEHGDSSHPSLGSKTRYIYFLCVERLPLLRSNTLNF